MCGDHTETVLRARQRRIDPQRVLERGLRTLGVAGFQVHRGDVRERKPVGGIGCAGALERRQGVARPSVFCQRDTVRDENVDVSS